jgi:hypothetical protein
MSLSSSIGGYLELELRNGAAYHRDAIALNSARNCFGLILQSRRPTKVYMPKYTCDVMLEPLERLGIEYQFYAIDEKLEIRDEINIGATELLVYTNYFGTKNNYSYELCRSLKDKAVIDCSQSFYFSSIDDSHAIYSPRKFFGVADGGYVITKEAKSDDFPVDTSYGRMEHLLRRIDNGAEDAYDTFKLNDASLVGQPIKRMSRLTEKILQGVDYESVRTRRLNNFLMLHRSLHTLNRLVIEIEDIDAPMAYPLLVQNGKELREKLIEQKIYVPTYWPNVFDWCDEEDLEYSLATNLLALPIDQRYSEEDMGTILGVINES